MFRLVFLTVLLMDAAGSEAGGGAGSGAGTGSQGSGSTSVTPPSTAGTGSNNQNTPSGTNNGTQNTGSQQQTDPNESDPAFGNWKALRDQATGYRTRVSELEGQTQTWTQIQTKASTLATTLGYTPEDFQAAFKADPMKTLAVLAQEEATRQGRQGQDGNGRRQEDGQDLDGKIKKMVENATKPANEFVNRQMSEAAMVKYETALTENITADPILKNAPPEVHDIVKEYLGEFFSTQPEVLLGFKMKGDYTPVKEAVTYIAGRLQGAFSAWLKANNQTGGFQQGNGTGQQGSQQGRTNAKVTLDQIIDDPSVLGSQYKL
jgi:hypothetical protein